MNSPGPFFAAPLFIVKGSYVQINPCDERHSFILTILALPTSAESL